MLAGDVQVTLEADLQTPPKNLSLPAKGSLCTSKRHRPRACNQSTTLTPSVLLHD